MGCGASMDEPCRACPPDAQRQPARHYCLNCGLPLCTECAEQHQAKFTGKFSSPHRVVPLGEYRQGVHAQYLADLEARGCLTHVSELCEWYCLEHDKLTCGVCIRDSHKKCDVKRISDLRKKWNEDIKRKLRRIGYDQKRLEQSLSQVSQRLQQAPEQRQHLKDQVHDQVVQQQEALEELKRQREQQVDEMVQEKEDLLKEQAQIAKQRSAELRAKYTEYGARLQQAGGLRQDQELQALRELHGELGQVHGVTQLEQDELQLALAPVTLLQPRLDQDGMEHAVGQLETGEGPNLADLYRVESSYPGTPGSQRTSVSRPGSLMHRRASRASLGAGSSVGSWRGE